jgi:hypothetical protein
MSSEMHAFLRESDVPTREAWQAAIDSLGLPVQLSLELSPTGNSGFSPVLLKGVSSGFELSLCEASEVLKSYPRLSSEIGNRDRVLTFSWGGDLSECACVLASVAALAKRFRARAYYPADDLLYSSADELISEFAQCV